MANSKALTNLGREPMSKGRLEAFSDGVIAVIITILVLNLHAPSRAGWIGWRPGLLPLLIYGVGFQLVASMWVLHHNSMVRLRHLNRKMLWANFLFLFLLSLFPLTVESVSLHPNDPATLVVFCANAMLCGVALSLFRLAAVRDHADDPEFQEWNAQRARLAAVGLGGVTLAMGAAFYSTYVSLGLVACMLILVLLTG